MSDIYLPLRLKRLRKNPAVRSMLCETYVRTEQLIAPLFISEQLKHRMPIKSMTGHYQLTLQDLPAEIAEISKLGIQAVLLFGIPAKKDSHGGSSLLDDGIIQQALRLIKTLNPNLILIADVCLCEYTDHGHCGVLAEDQIDNDQTLRILAQQALSYANAGADCIAPSSMTDGMVQAIRQKLDQNDRHEVAILSYSAKYSSSFYAPFREAAQGTPSFGDRKNYQMDPGNSSEALRETALDIAEGADMVMVKPAIHYLDIIVKIKQKFPEVPLCAYHVSGEYAMIKAAAEKGLIDQKQAMYESLTAIRRAGADLIITYFAKEFALLINDNSNLYIA